MPLSDIVNVNITLETAPVSQAGFGVPLVLGAHDHNADRIRFYTDLDGMVSDGFATTEPEYKAAEAIFAQTPRPEKIAVGRRANKPTQRWKLTVASVRNSTAYKVKVGSNTATFTSDASATNDEIQAGLLAQINGLTGVTLTATQGGSAGAYYTVLTGNTPAAWNAVEFDTSLLSIEQDHADPGLAADLAAIKLANDDWYGIVSLYNSKAEIEAIADFAESNEKIFVAATQDTPVITSATDDVASNLKTQAHARTAIIYHPSNGAFADAAWAGRLLPEDPGSETWKFKSLSGVSGVNLSATALTNARNKNCNYYYPLGGRNITAEGVVSSQEFIDVIRGRDWLKARLQERIFARLANAKKVPYTDAGVSIVEAEVRAQLREAVKANFLSASPEPTVTVPAVADVSPTDRAARLLPDVEFTGVIAGAIHKLTLNGVISV